VEGGRERGEEGRGGDENKWFLASIAGRITAVPIR